MAESDFRFKEDSIQQLMEAIPDILADQDRETGRFGGGIWVVTDQNVLFPLAAAWALPGPYHHDSVLLDAIVAGGNALIEDQDEKGMWEFRKKDGSTWGPIYMPWTYTRWIRVFGLVRAAMPPKAQGRWEKALLLGYAGISATALGRVHNIPAYHAMGLHHAGQIFNRPEWCEQATGFMQQVCEAQHPDGYWSEHVGPVVAYNFVYSDALGIYYALSQDASVLPALERAARFHANFVYPDGSRIETIDERNPYHAGAVEGNVGFSFTPEGRGFLKHQWQYRSHLSADSAAAFALYGEEGFAAQTPADRQTHHFVLGQSDAIVHRDGPWFVCLSGFSSPMTENRWVQDRQNFVSIYHDRAGLIIGGGNTKLQPLWSSFTVGDTSLLAHHPGDTSPTFTPPEGLTHIPSEVHLEDDTLSLRLQYGDVTAMFAVEILSETRARIHCEATPIGSVPVQANFTFLPHLGEDVTTGSGTCEPLDESAIEIANAVAWVAHHNWRFYPPANAKVHWPALPHNPYRKDGHAEVSEGRLVVSVEFAEGQERFECELEVM